MPKFSYMIHNSYLLHDVMDIEPTYACVSEIPVFPSFTHDDVIL